MPVRIVIIGGGLAGVAALKRLSDSCPHFEAIILEGEPRIGGRICTHVNENQWGTERQLELGATWIHGNHGDQMFSLADDACLKVRHITTKSVLLQEGGVKFPLPAQKFALSAYRTIVKGVGGYQYNSTAVMSARNMSVDDYVIARLDTVLKEQQPQNKNAIVKIVYQRMQREAEVCGADCMSDVSFKSFGSYKELKGKEHIVEAGYEAIIHYLLQGYEGRVFKNKTVTKISIETNHPDGRQVAIYTADGSKYTADHVIYTGSLGHLKAAYHTLFGTILPDYKVRAIERLGVGTVNKVFMEFDNLRFMPPDVQRFNLCWENLDQTSRIPWWAKKISTIETLPTCPFNTLIMWITGEAAQYIESIQDAELCCGCMAVMHCFLPKTRVPPCKSIIRTRWFTNKHFRGSYTYLPVDCDVGDIICLATPIYDDDQKPLILFAGEATHAKFYSTTQGAFLSGLREADIIISHYKQCHPKQDYTKLFDFRNAFQPFEGCNVRVTYAQNSCGVLGDQSCMDVSYVRSNSNISSITRRMSDASSISSVSRTMSFPENPKAKEILHLTDTEEWDTAASISVRSTQAGKSLTSKGEIEAGKRNEQQKKVAKSLLYNVCFKGKLTLKEPADFLDAGEYNVVMKGNMELESPDANKLSKVLQVNEQNKNPSTFQRDQHARGRVARHMQNVLETSSASQSSQTSSATSVSQISQMSQTTLTSQISQMSKATSTSQTSQISKATSISEISQVSKATSTSQSSQSFKPISTSQTSQVSKATSTSQSSQSFKPISASHNSQISKATSMSQSNKGSKVGSVSQSSKMSKPMNTSQTQTGQLSKDTSSFKINKLSKGTSTSRLVEQISKDTSTSRVDQLSKGTSISQLEKLSKATSTCQLLELTKDTPSPKIPKHEIHELLSQISQLTDTPSSQMLCKDTSTPHLREVKRDTSVSEANNLRKDLSMPQILDQMPDTDAVQPGCSKEQFTAQGHKPNRDSSAPQMCKPERDRSKAYIYNVRRDTCTPQIYKPGLPDKDKSLPRIHEVGKENSVPLIKETIPQGSSLQKKKCIKVFVPKINQSAEAAAQPTTEQPTCYSTFSHPVQSLSCSIDTWEKPDVYRFVEDVSSDDDEQEDDNTSCDATYEVFHNLVDSKCSFFEVDAQPGNSATPAMSLTKSISSAGTSSEVSLKRGCCRAPKEKPKFADSGLTSGTENYVITIPSTYVAQETPLHYAVSGYNPQESVGSLRRVLALRFLDIQDCGDGNSNNNNNNNYCCASSFQHLADLHSAVFQTTPTFATECCILSCHQKGLSSEPNLQIADFKLETDLTKKGSIKHKMLKYAYLTTVPRREFASLIHTTYATKYDDLKGLEKKRVLLGKDGKASTILSKIQQVNPTFLKSANQYNGQCHLEGKKPQHASLTEVAENEVFNIPNLPKQEQTKLSTGKNTLWGPSTNKYTVINQKVSCPSVAQSLHLEKCNQLKPIFEVNSNASGDGCDLEVKIKERKKSHASMTNLTTTYQNLCIRECAKEVKICPKKLDKTKLMMGDGNVVESCYNVAMDAKVFKIPRLENIAGEAEYNCNNNHGDSEDTLDAYQNKASSNGEAYEDPTEPKNKEIVIELELLSPDPQQSSQENHGDGDQMMQQNFYQSVPADLPVQPYLPLGNDYKNGHDLLLRGLEIPDDFLAQLQQLDLQLSDNASVGEVEVEDSAPTEDETCLPRAS